MLRGWAEVLCGAADLLTAAAPYMTADETDAVDRLGPEAASGWFWRGWWHEETLEA